MLIVLVWIQCKNKQLYTEMDFDSLLTVTDIIVQWRSQSQSYCQRCLKGSSFTTFFSTLKIAIDFRGRRSNWRKGSQVQHCDPTNTYSRKYWSRHTIRWQIRILDATIINRILCSKSFAATCFLRKYRYRCTVNSWLSAKLGGTGTTDDYKWTKINKA